MFLFYCLFSYMTKYRNIFAENVIIFLLENNYHQEQTL